jgi:hypothetical protein
MGDDGDDDDDDDAEFDGWRGGMTDRFRGRNGEREV